jgi:hypothetical protein
VGLEDVSRYPALTEELLRRGWSERDVLKVLGGNALRVPAPVRARRQALIASPDRPVGMEGGGASADRVVASTPRSPEGRVP